MYDQKWFAQSCINGQWRDFLIRAHTNDENTVRSVFGEDEYKLQTLYCRPGGNIVDFGGHIGSFSILAATLKPDAKIFSYEPCAENMELFIATIARNKLGDHISANLKAVWGKDDEVIQIYFGDETAFGSEHRFNCSHYAGWGKTDKDKKFDIETVSLHSIIENNKLDKIDILKMDCEGVEYEIFKTASKEDLQKIEVIVGEYHNVLKPPFQNPRKELLDLLQGLFEDHSEGQAPDVVMPKILADIPYHGNFLFKRKL